MSEKNAPFVKFKADAPKRGSRHVEMPEDAEWKKAIESLLPGEAVVLPIREQPYRTWQMRFGCFAQRKFGSGSCATRLSLDRNSITIYRLK